MPKPSTIEFQFDDVPTAGKLLTGHVYQRAALHHRFGGNTTKGIVPSKREKVVLLFHTKEKIQQFYSDGYDPAEGVYWYSGEGTVGDMRWNTENRAIRDHEGNNADMYLFERAQRKGGFWRLYGMVKCLGYKEEIRLDKNKAKRKAIVFSLLPITSNVSEEENIAYPLHKKNSDLSAIREAARKAPTVAGRRQTAQQVYMRSERIKRYALARASGKCELCGGNAPFLTKKDIGYLEVHHINRLADDGLESIESVGAVCPNCHRRCHYGKDADKCNAKLQSVVDNIENV